MNVGLVHLLPCPFCRSLAEGPHKNSADVYVIRCSNLDCGAELMEPLTFGRSKNAASRAARNDILRARWNRREP